MRTLPYDLIVFGASGFVGQILVRELATSFTPQQLSWAVAGRSADKLQAVCESLPPHSRPGMVIADAGDEASLAELCRQTRVVVSTVGPYCRHGEALVRACVSSGTDYCDITGEVHWVLQMMSRYQAQALQSGARLFHCCGFDSIPSDLGVQFTHQLAREQFKRPCDSISLRVARLKGSFSGGTYASLFEATADIQRTPGLAKALADPYCLCPSDHPYRLQQKHWEWADYDELSRGWACPFVMAPVNTRIVHRSNALLNHAYGEHFAYDEALSTGRGRKGRKRASRSAFGLKLLFAAAYLPLLRTLLERWYLPKPGEGPTVEAQLAGGFEFHFYGRVRGRGEVCVRLRGERDPGYGATARMLAQTSYLLAKETPRDALGGGFWTPASGLGPRLRERLEAYAGLHFEHCVDGFESQSA